MIRSKLMRAAATVALLAVTTTAVTPALAMAGTVRITGSTTVQPLAQAWANAYKSVNPGTTSRSPAAVRVPASRTPPRASRSACPRASRPPLTAPPS